jgi:chemotaxis protein CheY-P-specific phosphatase CheC
MNNNEYKKVNSENTITIDQNVLRDIIKMVYQDGANNVGVTDYNVHLSAIEAAMEIIMDSVI